MKLNETEQRRYNYLYTLHATERTPSENMEFKDLQMKLLKHPKHRLEPKPLDSEASNHRSKQPTASGVEQDLLTDLADISASVRSALKDLQNIRMTFSEAKGDKGRALRQLRNTFWSLDKVLHPDKYKKPSQAKKTPNDDEIVDLDGRPRFQPEE